LKGGKKTNRTRSWVERKVMSEAQEARTFSKGKPSMKALVLGFVLVAMCGLGITQHVAAADAPVVDLTGKTGVVDPKDLKKDDPKPPKVQGTPPPPPPSSSKK
jgi:hypothetical protein